MTTEPVVLILGAGASMPFGFPSGSDLKKEIVSLQDSDSELRRCLIAANSPQDDIVEFAKALGSSPFSSVDRCLEYGSIFRPKDREIGCAAIAAALLIKSGNLPARRDFDWIEILFNALAPRFEETGKGALTVVTYNYDCSFEYLFYRGLQTSIERKRADAMFANVTVIHLHGRLAPSKERWQPLSVSPELVRESIDPTKGIRIIHEQNPDMEQFDEARAALQAAKRVCFLGFGYDGINLERLLGKLGTSWLADRFVCGSAYDRTAVENWNVNMRYFGGRFRFGESDWKIARFLRESGALEEICHLRPQESPN